MGLPGLSTNFESGCYDPQYIYTFSFTFTHLCHFGKAFQMNLEISKALLYMNALYWLTSELELTAITDFPRRRHLSTPTQGSHICLPGRLQTQYSLTAHEGNIKKKPLPMKPN